MENQIHLPYLRELIIFLIAAALLVPTFQRIRISPTLGFLLIGTLIGPFGLGMFVDQISFFKYAVIDDVEGVKALAELGIVFLLFTVGLELTGERLWAMRRLIFGLGFTQVVCSALAIGLILWMIGISPQVSVIIGACLALSSTAMVVQLLIEKGEFSSPLGKTSFSILLFQDLAVVPILLLVGFLGAGTQNGLVFSLLTALGTAIAVVAVIVVLGRIVLRPLFRLVTFRNSPEFFMAMTLLIVIGSSLGTAMAGLSIALGAFLAGLLLAETEFRHQIEIDIEPFKGLFMGLFFMSIGMGIDMRVIWQDMTWIMAGVIGLLLIKAFVTIGLALAFKVPRHIAFSTGVLLAQGGEFTFVVIAMATSLSLIPGTIAQYIIVVASLSMIATPFMMSLALMLKNYLSPDIHKDHPYNISENEEELEGHVIIAGFGRVGQVIAQMLSAQQTSYVAVDRNGSRVITMKNAGHSVLFGNASRKEVLQALGADKAAALVISVDDIESAALTIKVCKEGWPNLPIFVRAHDHLHSEELVKIGAKRVVAETSESSLRLAGYVLNELGVPVDSVSKLTERLREEHMKLHDDKAKENNQENQQMWSDDLQNEKPSTGQTDQDSPFAVEEDDSSKPPKKDVPSAA